LRFTFAVDASFALAVDAVAREIAKALRAPTTWGKPLEHDLTGWRRSAFASESGSGADLRLIFRPHDGARIDVLMFGPRYLPDTTSIYHAAKVRT
jgi:hypothetical protein